MKKACLVVDKVYQKNKIFDVQSYLNRDNCLEFFHELKKQFIKLNLDLQTQDLCSLDEAEFVIYNEIPKNLSDVKYPEKSAVLLFESELIRRNNWCAENHKFFKYIFTWHNEFVDNKKYFKFNFTHSGGVPFKRFLEKTKFCTLVAGDKYVQHPLELYSKRIEAIRWFEKYHPDQFEFYGMGWGLYTFKIPLISKVLNKIKPLRKFLAKKWSLYRGPVQDKLQMMQDFKFSICYENAYGIPGYITEKIFDSMAAGCVLVYWGAQNISDFIPKECYVDKTLFESYEDLYAYLMNMSEDEYNSRLDAIKSYLVSDQHKLFEPEFNAKVIVGRMTNA